MFDKYLICENSLRNVTQAGNKVGFAFDARLGYYRGLGLSMVEDLAITVDGEAMPREAVRFNDDGKELSLNDMEKALDRRWEFGAVATINVLRPGGLTPGKHRLEFKEVLRISYMPFPSTAADMKEMNVTA